MNLKLPKKRSVKGPASIWKRIFAFIIDFFILNYIIFFPLKKHIIQIQATSYSEIMELTNNSEITLKITLVFFVASFLAIIYFTVLEKKFGQSVGKMLLNINVISDMKQMKIWQLLVRNMFLVPIFPFILLWIIDPIFMIANKEKKRLSEILSKTRVIENYSY